MQEAIGGKIGGVDEAGFGVFANELADHLQGDAEVRDCQQARIPRFEFSPDLPAMDACFDDTEVVTFQGFHLLPMLLVQRRLPDLVLVEEDLGVRPVRVVKGELGVDAAPQAFWSGLRRGEGGFELPHDLFHLLQLYAAVEIGLVAEVQIDRSHGDPGPAGYRGERCLMVSAFAEDFLCRRQNPAAMLVLRLLADRRNAALGGGR